MFESIRQLTPAQRNAFLAALGGWTLDAFDFFLFVFCLKAIAADFSTDIASVAEGIFLTLAFRPLGALVFGWLAEKYGRRPILMINVVSFAAVELASAFAPSLAVLLILRAVFGFAMGGEWGVGAALAMESLPARGRGFFSGLLQEGYVLGFLLASVLFAYVFEYVGWRGMFVIGVLPALLVLYIRSSVEESPAWREGRQRRRVTLRESWTAVRGYFPTLIFLVVLMAFFNAFSHGSQDLYPTFLQVQHHYSPRVTGNLAIVMNLGALMGGIFFGALSEKIGRKRAIMLAAVLAIPLVPLWAWSHSVAMFAVGGFAMQFMVQGAWGIVPAHLNELSPASVRAILPGFAYQLGNLAMAKMAPVQAGIAEAHGGNYALVLSVTLVVVAVALVIITALGREARGVSLE